MNLYNDNSLRHQLRNDSMKEMKAERRKRSANYNIIE